MNIFAVDADPIQAARDLCDRHVVKMTLETAQILCSAFDESPYKKTHFNHPCCKWARTSKSNYQWLIAHGLGLSAEYTLRYGKTHKSEQVIQWCMTNMHKLNFSQESPTHFVQCMPQQYQSDDPIQSYRNFYINEKSKFAQWNKKRKAPGWYTK